MSQRPPILTACDSGNPGDNLPSHDFHIGENNSAHIGQLPSFRAMAFHVLGKAPFPTPAVPVDSFGMGPYVLGRFVGDATLKLLRPWPVYGADPFVADPSQGLIEDIADGLLPLSPASDAVRCSFYCRIGEFLEIALHQPGRLTAIVANIDALTNARLTDRARAILLTGDDPGHADLWESVGILELSGVQP